MQDGWVMLDVRPPNEVERVAIEGAIAVPLFVPDPARDLGAFIKAASAFGLGGWWLGGTHMVPNSDFMKQVGAVLRMLQWPLGLQTCIVDHWIAAQDGAVWCHLLFQTEWYLYCKVSICI